MLFNRKTLSILCLSLLGAVAGAQMVEFVPNEVLVRFKGSNAAIVQNSANAANAAIGATTKYRIPKIMVDRIRIPNGMTVNDALSYYGQLSTVEYVERISKAELDFVPNDSMYNSQYAPQKVKLPQAWDIGKGSASVIVAIIDTGIDLNHEDLKNKLVQGYDFSDNDSDPTATDTHGVHCAGIAAAETNNGKGIAGAGFNTKIMPLKIFPNIDDGTISSAIIYAADNGAKVISMSFGSYSESQTQKNAVNYAWGKGLILCATAGNDNITTKRYPGAFDKVICVGSTGTQDIKSGFSNYGADWVDVAAPGENIMSSVIGGYGQLSGTSMACPLVAGVASLLWGSAIPGTTNTQIRAALESSTDPVPGNYFKFGRINAFKAISKLDPGSVTVSPVTAAANWFGINFVGGPTELATRDGSLLSVRSIPNPLGQVAGPTVDVSFTTATTNLNLAQVVVEANGPSKASGQLFIWNFTSNKFVLVKAFALKDAGVNQQKVSLPKELGPFVSGGIMRLGVRAVGPNKPLRGTNSAVYDLTIDLLRVETRENPAQN